MYATAAAVRCMLLQRLAMQTQRGLSYKVAIASTVETTLVSRAHLLIAARGTHLLDEVLPCHDGIQREKGIMVLHLSIKAYTDVHLYRSQTLE